jgi:hypothetical protein
MADDRLEHFALVERANDGSDHVHQFEVLPFHVASEQALRIRSQFKKPAVKLVSELSTDRPDRVERLSDKLSLFRRHDWQPQKSEVRVAYISPKTARNNPADRARRSFDVGHHISAWRLLIYVSRTEILCTLPQCGHLIFSVVFQAA